MLRRVRKSEFFRSIRVRLFRRQAVSYAISIPTNVKALKYVCVIKIINSHKNEIFC